MTPDEFAEWLAKEKLSSWQGGRETAMAWAQSEVDATYRLGRNGLAPVSAPVTAASLVFECWARADLRTMGRVSDALADELMPWLDDWGCDDFTRSLVFRAATDGWPLPRRLHQFARENIGRKSRKRSRGERYWKISARNHIGAQILAVLTKGFNLQPTRNAQPKARNSETEVPLCACEVLAKVTERASWAAINYSSAAEIWTNRVRLWTELEVICRVKQFSEPPPCLPPVLAREFLTKLSALGDGP